MFLDKEARQTSKLEDRSWLAVYFPIRNTRERAMTWGQGPTDGISYEYKTEFLCKANMGSRPPLHRGNVLASRFRVRGFKPGWGRWIFSGGNGSFINYVRVPGVGDWKNLYILLLQGKGIQTHFYVILEIARSSGLAGIIFHLRLEGKKKTY